MRLRAMGAAALCAATTVAQAGDARTITFTTRSDEARRHAAEAVRRIETFQTGPQIQEAARKAIAADPDFAWGHYLLAAATFPPPQARPEHDKALELAAKASPAEQKYLAAMKLNREQKGKEALESFKQLREEFPEERLVHMMIGQLSLNQGQFEEAQKSFEKAIALDDTTPRAHAFIGNTLLLRGEYARARAEYDAALKKRAPGTAPGGVFYPRSLSHLYEGNVDEALAGLRAFLGEYKQNKLDANFPEVFIWNSIARINLENGRLEEAIKAYQEGFKSVPGSTLEENDKTIWLGRLHHGTGRTLARMGKHEEAWKEAEVLKKMIDEGGEQGKQFVPAYHYMAGYLKLEAGDAKAALEHMKQANPDDPFHKLLLARAYERTGDKESAKKAYAEIVAFNVNTLERALAYPEAKKKLASM